MNHHLSGFVFVVGLALSGCAHQAPARPVVSCGADGALVDLGVMRDAVNAQMVYPTGGGVSANAIYASLEGEARAAQGKAEHLRVLEDFVYDLGDHHAHIGTNGPSSRRLVPSSAMVWAAARGGQIVVTEVRPGSPARAGGLREGMVIEEIDGTSAVGAIAPPPSTAENAEAMLGFGARVKLAGTHDHDPRIVARGGGASADVQLSLAPGFDLPPAVLSWPAPDLAVIRLSNSLGQSELPVAFDRLMREAVKAKAILLDLRDTPSGGDSSIAKPVMSWFVEGTKGYQTHQRGAKTWTEKVTGRRDHFTGRLIVLVDHWTGSMGEGVAIGLRAAAGATLVGTPMAGLRGAIEQVELPCLGAPFRLPVERLFEVSGAPRELAKPDLLVSEGELAAAGSGDAVMERALKLAQQ